MKEDGKTLQEKKSRKKIRSDGKIAGQGMKKDSVTTLLFQANNENFAELFNRTLLADEPVVPEELGEENIKETAYLRVTKEAGGTRWYSIGMWQKGSETKGFSPFSA